MSISAKLYFDTWKGNRRFCYHLFWINCLEKGTLVLVAGRYCISLQQLKLSLTMAQDITGHFHCRSLKTCQMYATLLLSAQSIQRTLLFHLQSSVLSLHREHSTSVYGAQCSVYIENTPFPSTALSTQSEYAEHSTSIYGAQCSVGIENTPLLSMELSTQSA